VVGPGAWVALRVLDLARGDPTDQHGIADHVHLPSGGWILGQYSIADIHLFRLFWRVSSALQLERAR
jgi:hypothetical protein